MQPKSSKIIRELYFFFSNFIFQNDGTSFKNNYLLKKSKRVNFFLSKNILSFINTLNLPKQITGLSLKSYTKLIQVILTLRKFPIIKYLFKFNFFFKIVLFFYIIFLIIIKIKGLFFLKILIINKNFIVDKKIDYYLFFNFPNHSFQKSKSTIYPSSVYENIFYKKKNANIKCLSFGSYERISRKKILNNKNSDVLKISSKFSIIEFFIFVFFFFKNSNKFFNAKLPIEISLLNLLNLLGAFYYEVIVKNLKITYNINVKKIFFLGLNNPFPYCYNYSIKSHINEFFYSENFFNPPLESLEKPYDIKILNLIYFRLWGVTNHPVGFVTNIRNINEIQKKFLSFLKNEIFLRNSNYKLLPSSLGYENYTRLSGKNNIIFFDIKPYLNIEENLANNPIFNFFSSENFVSKFNTDIISAIGETNFNFFLKPKYSLDYKLHKNYKRNLEEKLEIYDNFKIIDPYANLAVLSKNFFVSISIPFTSISKITRNMGIPSKYYCPDDFVNLFKGHYNNKNILFGRKSLLNWINYEFQKIQNNKC